MTKVAQRRYQNNATVGPGMIAAVISCRSSSTLGSAMRSTTSTPPKQIVKRRMRSATTQTIAMLWLSGGQLRLRSVSTVAAARLNAGTRRGARCKPAICAA
nr:hypothetical protein [Rhizobium leguminosarum]